MPVIAARRAGVRKNRVNALPPVLDLSTWSGAGTGAQSVTFTTAQANEMIVVADLGIDFGGMSSLPAPTLDGTALTPIMSSLNQSGSGISLGLWFGYAAAAGSHTVASNWAYNHVPWVFAFQRAKAGAAAGDFTTQATGSSTAVGSLSLGTVAVAANAFLIAIGCFRQTSGGQCTWGSGMSAAAPGDWITGAVPSQTTAGKSTTPGTSPTVSATFGGTPANAALWSLLIPHA